MVKYGNIRPHTKKHTKQRKQQKAEFCAVRSPAVHGFFFPAGCFFFLCTDCPEEVDRVRSVCAAVSCSLQAVAHWHFSSENNNDVCVVCCRSTLYILDVTLLLSGTTGVSHDYGVDATTGVKCKHAYDVGYQVCHSYTCGGVYYQR